MRHAIGRWAVTTIIAIVTTVGLNAGVGPGAASAAYAAGTGLPDDVMLFQRNPYSNNNTNCPITPIGGVATDGTRLYTAGPGSNCVPVNFLSMNRQRTGLAGLVDGGLWLYDVHADGSATQSRNQLFNFANPKCDQASGLGWMPDGATVTCYRSASSGLIWQNVLTAATGRVTSSQLGLPQRDGYVMTWLPDGNLLVFGTVPGCTGTVRWQIAMNGLTPTGPATRVGPSCPTDTLRGMSVSPDGTRVSYMAYGPNGVNARLATSDLDGNTETVVLTQTAETGYYSNPVWSPNGQHLLASVSFEASPRNRSGIGAVDVRTGESYWALPPQPTFDALYPQPANVPDATPTSLRTTTTLAITAVNGNTSATSATSGDTLTVTGTGFDPGNPPTTVTVCNSTGTTCLALPVEHVTVDATGRLTCTVVIPATYTPGASSGGTTTGTPGGSQPTSGMTFPSGSGSSTSPPPKPSPGLYLSPNHGLPGATTTVGVDYLGASQTVRIAAFASTDATGTPLPGPITVTASPCGCLIAPFSVPAGTRTIAALNVTTDAVIALAAWHPDDETPPVVTGTPDRAPDGSGGWYNHPVTITWSATDPDDPESALALPTPTTADTEGGGVEYRSGQSCDPSGNCASGTYVVSLDATSPTISASLSRAPDFGIWHNAPIHVTFSCQDTLSGIATCPDPVTLSGDAAGQQVSGTAVDQAGNTASTSVVVNLDANLPTISASLSRSPDSGIWHNAPVEVTFSCQDEVSGIAYCSAPVDVSADGVSRQVAGSAVDLAGNSANTSLTVNLDTTKPLVQAPTFGTSPVVIGGSTTMTATASDAVSGVAGGEMWVDTDPGVGQGSPVTWNSGTMSTTLSGLPAGIHTVGVRARDIAGNWSTSSTALLVVYDPNGGFATGGGWIVPGAGTSDPGDVLPGLDRSSRANFGFVVRYQNGQSAVPSGNFEFHYKTGGFQLSSTGYRWLVVTNSQWAHFQGSATVKGSTEVYPIRIDARDSDKAGNPDRIVLKVYAPHADPSTASPLYQASGDVTGGSVTIHSS